MKRPKHAVDHSIAPKAWRHTPNITGDYDMDASIMHSNSKALPGKLDTHVKNAYGYRTMYNGYGGLTGDD